MDLEKEKEELHIDRTLDTSGLNAGQASPVIYSKEAWLAEEAEGRPNVAFCASGHLLDGGVMARPDA